MEHFGEFSTIENLTLGRDCEVPATNMTDDVLHGLNIPSQAMVSPEQNISGRESSLRHWDVGEGIPGPVGVEGEEEMETEVPRLCAVFLLL